MRFLVGRYAPSEPCLLEMTVLKKLHFDAAGAKPDTQQRNLTGPADTALINK
jgi:hypothetical protein